MYVYYIEHKQNPKNKKRGRPGNKAKKQLQYLLFWPHYHSSMTLQLTYYVRMSVMIKRMNSTAQIPPPTITPTIVLVEITSS